MKGRLTGLLVLAGLGIALARSKKYKEGDDVVLFANKVGPFRNPSETYMYYDLPFCRPPEGLKHKPEGLGEVVEGNRLIHTAYKLSFRKDIAHTDLCTFQLTKEGAAKFRKAIEDDWYFNMYYDDLPVYGFIGKVEKLFVRGMTEAELSYLLFTHFDFVVHYNGERVIEISVTTDTQKAVDITADKPVDATFSYSVKWLPTTIPFEKRMEKYSRHSFLPQHLEIHWFSIINSCVTVLLLTGFLTTIMMRILRRDFHRYTADRESVGEDIDESGWKYVHADVFRFPHHKALLCAAIGTGTQLLFLTFSLLLLALMDLFYPYSRGSMYTAIIVLYALTACIAGYQAASYYKQMQGGAWARTLLLTCFLFFGPTLVVFSINNTVAIIYRSTMALPFGTIVAICAIWTLITVPLTVVGGIVGKNTKSDFNAPCRTGKYPREIPTLPWYRGTPAQMAIAGLLPFSAIYIELFYVFSSLWGHKVYTVWYILFLVFCILVLVTAFLTVALTYSQLSVEDHRWWWRSFMCGGSTGIYIYAYAFYYFYFRSDMEGFLQVAFYFGYMGINCYGFFLMLGFVGWRASLAFIRRIYGAIKTD